ncbi:aldehyde dehydrogenase [Nocardia carnea]|uniref:aldehyde dehydrogenase (NAD(+)) n=1 Tax=Nocardia carnea TaxID=37328 RepID=A0ABW7TSW0_9NOCA|nr:aldehyde dehydrogenase [Nocardia carnea]
MRRYESLFIGGEWVPPGSDLAFEVISPHTEDPIARIAAPAPADIDRAVAAARQAFDTGPWPRLDPAERIRIVRDLAGRYEERVEEIAQLVTAEMGAPITFSRSAHARLPGVMMRALADLAAGFPWQESRPGYYGSDIQVRHEPVGVVGAVAPWNMPMLMVVAKLVPALLAGCTVVLKPSPETPLDAYLMAELVADSEIPPGVVSILPGDRDTGRYLVVQPDIDKVSFTGSTAAGREVAAACGAALKRVSLELGGKSAAVVLDDADPAEVAAGIQVAALMNGGQACVAQTRILVPHHRRTEYIDAVAAMVNGLTVGDPADDSTRIGPVVTARQRQRIRDYIQLGTGEGARLITGGHRPPTGLDRGWYVQPTLFTDVESTMRIAREEIFGPVLTVLTYRDLDHAVQLADDTEYGLSGSVWTPDIDRGLAVAHRIRSGTLGINQAYSMDPHAPFGGVKASGIGREFGREGLAGFLDTKSISVAGA